MSRHATRRILTNDNRMAISSYYTGSTWTTLRVSTVTANALSYKLSSLARPSRSTTPNQY